MSFRQFNILEAETYEQTAVGWEENQGHNEGNIGLLNPHCNHLASEHSDRAAELFGDNFLKEHINVYFLSRRLTPAVLMWTLKLDILFYLRMNRK